MATETLWMLEGALVALRPHGLFRGRCLWHGWPELALKQDASIQMRAWSVVSFAAHSSTPDEGRRTNILIIVGIVRFCNTQGLHRQNGEICDAPLTWAQTSPLSLTAQVDVETAHARSQGQHRGRGHDFAHDAYSALDHAHGAPVLNGARPKTLCTDKRAIWHIVYDAGRRVET